MLILLYYYLLFVHHRGALKKKGIVPKDYMKENRRQLKESQRNNRDNEYMNDFEPEPLYKLTQFQNVPSRVFEDTDKAPYKEVSGDFLRRGQNEKRKEELGIEARVMRNDLERRLREKSERQNASPPTPRKAAVFADVAKCAPKSNTNFIAQNKVDSIHPSVLKFSQQQPGNSKSQKMMTMKKHDEFGRVPAYLSNRKQEWADEAEYQRLNAPDPNCPKGMVLMPEGERVDTLNTLKASLAEAMNQLSSMPFVLETPSLKRKHAMLETKIKEIENAVALFSRQKVYIAKDS